MWVMRSDVTKRTCTVISRYINIIISAGPPKTPHTKTVRAHGGEKKKRVEMRNVVLQLQWFSWREAVCVFSWGMCRPSWNWVNGAPLKGCIVWTLTKPNWFGQILTEGQVEVCLCVGVYVSRCVCGCVCEFRYECAGMWVYVCAHACMCTCLIWFTYKKTLCVPTKRHIQVLVLTSPWCWQLVYGGYGSVYSAFAWCFDAVMYLCVILAPCHSSFLLQASSVNAQLFTVSPAHHLASLIALDLRLAR